MSIQTQTIEKHYCDLCREEIYDYSDIKNSVKDKDICSDCIEIVVQNNILKDNELFEIIAGVQHDIWINWMRYLFSVCKTKKDKKKLKVTVTIPPEKVGHWKRQMKTRYQNLTEQEKESDRNQAVKVINEIQDYL